MVLDFENFRKNQRMGDKDDESSIPLCGMISAFGFNSILQYRMINVIESLDQVGMLFFCLISVARNAARTPNGSRRRESVVADNKHTMETGRQMCRTRYRIVFRVRGKDQPECAEKPEDTSRTSG